MNTLSKLLCLTLATGLVACNEKVSPELQGAASTSTSGGGSSTPVTPPSEYFFRLTNTADTLLNFKLHKTGTGNANANCEITSTTALSSDNYRTSPSTYDITCYLEAEELVLNHNGLSYTIEASKNTCEYIGYMPFSYYNFQPGSSSQTFNQVICSNADNTLLSTGILQADAPRDPVSGNPLIDAAQACDTYRTTAAGGSVNVVPESEAALCNFNYSEMAQFEDAPNCDEGVLSINDYTCSGEDTDNDGSADRCKWTTTVRSVKCGGKAVNCIRGPIKEVPILSKYTSGIEVSRVPSNAAYVMKYDLPKLYGTGYSNMTYVNYRRDLASVNIEYGNSGRNYNDADPDNDSVLSSAYMGSFGDPIYKNSYDPMLMSLYSTNQRMDGSELVTSAMRSARRYDYLRGPGSAGNAYAAEPFLGLSGYKTNPFYAFYCFDNAYDVKARIRMVVREWDRALPLSATSSYFERISDVDLLPPLARQDVPYTVEVTGDPDSWNDFNDIWDWDDFIDMERDDAGVPYDPSITVFRPEPKNDFSDGFLNPYVFPMELPEQ